MEITTKNGTMTLGQIVYHDIGLSLPARPEFIGVELVNGQTKFKVKNVRTGGIEYLEEDDIYNSLDSCLNAMRSKELRNIINSIDIFYAWGFDGEKRIPTVGLRGVKDIQTKHDCWMISGTVYDKNGVELNTVEKVANADSTCTVVLRAQALLSSKIINIPIGNFKIVKNTWNGEDDYVNNRGYLHLVK